jgi:hypothetical protein
MNWKMVGVLSGCAGVMVLGFVLILTGGSEASSMSQFGFCLLALGAGVLIKAFGEFKVGGQAQPPCQVIHRPEQRKQPKPIPYNFK